MTGGLTVTAAQAVSKIASGERVLVGSGAAEPTSLVEAMTARATDLGDVGVLHIFTLGGRAARCRAVGRAASRLVVREFRRTRPLSPLAAKVGPDRGIAFARCALAELRETGKAIDSGISATFCWPWSVRG
ncbi:MAG: hypothetical protein ACYCO9_21295 [Streptosporangiaceae bacterium]